MWCWPWHAPNRNLVAGLMKSLFRLFAVICIYGSAAIGALTPVNNARPFRSRLLMGQAIRGFLPPRSEIK
jgi:hypothetical protein